MHSGNSLDAAYDYLKELVLNNPEDITKLIADLSDNLLLLYDEDQNFRDFGKSAKEMLGAILQCKDGESLKGFVCMGIHEFGMKLLHDCNIPAVVLCGTSENANHATLLYQRPDGKFVFENYNFSMVIDAPSLVDAAKIAYKKSGNLESAGYISFLDDNSSYQKFAFEQEALWSNELDKMDYNKTSPFTNPITSDKTNISGDIQVSNLGNTEASITGNKVYGDADKTRQVSLSLGYKKNGETALFDNSMAAGIKLEFNGVNKSADGNETFFETKSVIQDVMGERYIDGFEGTKMSIPTLRNFLVQAAGVSEEVADRQCSDLDFTSRPAKVQKSDNISTFLRCVFGKKNTIVEGENLKLDNIGQVSLLGSGTICKSDTNNNLALFGDARVTIEDGLSLRTKSDNWQMQNNLSVGCVADLKFTGGKQHGGIQSGVKLNAGTSFVTKPSESTTIGAEVEGHVVALKPYQDYGTSGSLFVSHQIAPQKSIYGKAIFETDTQNLSIGGFSGKSYDKTTFGATVGAQIRNTNVYVTYNQTINGQNRTYDNSVVSIGARVNF